MYENIINASAFQCESTIKLCLKWSAVLPMFIKREYPGWNQCVQTTFREIQYKFYRFVRIALITRKIQGYLPFHRKSCVKWWVCPHWEWKKWIKMEEKLNGAKFTTTTREEDALFNAIAPMRLRHSPLRVKPKDLAQTSKKYTFSWTTKSFCLVFAHIIITSYTL